LKNITTSVLVLLTILCANTIIAANLEGDEIKDAYTGEIRLFIVEPVSRYYDATSSQFNFGFIAYGMFETLNITDGGLWENSTHLNLDGAGWGDVLPDNVKVIAVVFNSTGITTDSYPPNGQYFDAHYADATAAALPGEIGRNYTGDGYTHTVFLEEGTSDT